MLPEQRQSAGGVELPGGAGVEAQQAERGLRGLFLLQRVVLQRGGVGGRGGGQDGGAVGEEQQDAGDGADDACEVEGQQVHVGGGLGVSAADEEGLEDVGLVELAGEVQRGAAVLVLELEELGVVGGEQQRDDLHVAQRGCQMKRSSPVVVRLQ